LALAVLVSCTGEIFPDSSDASMLRVGKRRAGHRHGELRRQLG
jgi:hypothetical protein